MADLRKAAQMALETLDNMVKVDWHEWDEFASVEDFVRWAKSRASFTAEALRAALAQPEPWVKTYSGGKPNYTEPCERCGEVNPAEIHTCTPKQREMNKDEYIKFLESACRDIYEVWAGSEGIPMPETAPEGYLLFLVEQMRDIAKRALAQPEQEPVAWICHQLNKVNSLWWDKNQAVHLNAGFKFTPLYTAPPQRKWQGLTDEELLDIADMAYANDLELLQTLQAKLKEKNSTSEKNIQTSDKND